MYETKGGEVGSHMKLTDKEKTLVFALCRNDLNQVATGRELHYHTNTVRYHAARIEKKTGHNPLTFMGALALLVELGLYE